MCNLLSILDDIIKIYNKNKITNGQFLLNNACSSFKLVAFEKSSKLNHSHGWSYNCIPFYCSLPNGARNLTLSFFTSLLLRSYQGHNVSKDLNYALCIYHLVTIWSEFWKLFMFRAPFFLRATNRRGFDLTAVGDLKVSLL